MSISINNNIYDKIVHHWLHNSLRHIYSSFISMIRTDSGLKSEGSGHNNFLLTSHHSMLSKCNLRPVLKYTYDTFYLI